MSVAWYCVPSARPTAEADVALAKWRERGYTVALFVDKERTEAPLCHLLIQDSYPGYSQAVNRLVKRVLEIDPECQYCITGGDDTFPDPNHIAEEIARQCSEHFIEASFERLSEGAHGQLPEHLRFNHAKLAALDTATLNRIPNATFGVMQPVGDRWGENPAAPDPRMRSAYIDRVCGSPWMGREWCRRINQGHGPLWPEYFHMFEDEEAFEVATKLGVLWQRSDLLHHHEHWARKRADSIDMPEFLKQANSPENWAASKAIFDKRKAAGFPGSEPLP